MAYVIEGEKAPLIYIANYRVGSTATAATLMKMGAKQLGSHHSLPKHLPENAIVAQTVRHHCDVLVSYWFKRDRRFPLIELIDSVLADEDKYLRGTGFYNRIACNYIMRYDTLQHEFNTLCLNAGLRPTQLEVDPSPRPSTANWKKFIDSKLARRIYNHYSEEMDKMGYTADGTVQ